MGGIAAQDDTENFEQVTEATRGTVGQNLVFNYQMGLNREAEFIPPPSLPGKVGPYFSEQGQRNFYHHWADMMDLKPSNTKEVNRAEKIQSTGLETSGLSQNAEG